MWSSRAVAVFLLLAFQTSSAEQVRSALIAASKETPDGSDFAETSSYRELVRALLELKPVDIEALNPEAFDVARALSEPDAQRGAWVRANGNVLGSYKIALDIPAADLKRVERVIMRLAPGQEIACDLIGDPPPYKTLSDTVQVSGVFFRTVVYVDKNGKERTLPYMLARSMEHVATPSSTLAKSLFNAGPELYTGIFLGALGVVVFVLYLRRSARSDSDPDTKPGAAAD